VARWRSVLAVEGSPTGDGRLFELGALAWRDLPLTLLYMPATAGGHDGSFPIGRIETIERMETGEGTAEIVAEGSFAETDDPAVLEAIRSIEAGEQRGVSIDVILDEYRIAPFEEGLSLVDEDGNEIEDDVDQDEDGEIDAEAEDDEVWLQVENVVTIIVSRATIGAATVVALPAFEEGVIESVAEEAALVASAAPAVPPGEWFADPGLDGPTPITVRPDGRIFGHLAVWGTCHTGLDGCVPPPPSPSGYALFHLGERETDGGPVAVGSITLDTGHAPMGASGRAAIEHYDHTGAAVADVRAGEDPHGIWIAGALRPGLSEDRVIELRAAKLSGDWRDFGSGLDLIGALGVNVPGYPVPRAVLASGADADRPRALVAAGTLRAATRASRLRATIEPLRASARDDDETGGNLSPRVRSALSAWAEDYQRQREREDRAELAALEARLYGDEIKRLGAAAFARDLRDLGERARR
jgi:hypothetical protein